MLHIYIPSKARADNQVALRHLPQQLRSTVTLVTPAEEKAAYSDVCKTYGAAQRATPPSVQGIAATRQWILDTHVRLHGDEPLCMMDDDLTFAVRREDEPTLFRPAKDADVVRAFKALERELTRKGGAAHAGFGAREGGHMNTEPETENTRILRVLGYRPGVLKALKIRFDRVRVMEDFDVALQLLRAGHTTRLLNRWVHNQGSSNAPGGCSTYRTADVQSSAAETLAALHPGFVRTVRKQTKTAWNGLPRTDVVVSWKRAYASSQTKEL